MSSNSRRTSLTRPWASGTHQLRARLAEHTARKRLEAELARYSTPAERMELDAMLERYEFAEVADIHRIVERHRAA